MKNMRSFSVTIFTALIVLSSVPIVAMEGPEFDFEGMNRNFGERYDKAKQGIQDGIQYVTQKAQDGMGALKGLFFNAPKAEQITESDKIESDRTSVSQNSISANDNAEVATSLIPEVTSETPIEAHVALPETHLALSTLGEGETQAESIIFNNSNTNEVDFTARVITPETPTAAILTPPLLNTRETEKLIEQPTISKTSDDVIFTPSQNPPSSGAETQAPVVNTQSQAANQVVTGFSFKNFFNQASEAIKSRGAQLKATIQAHPVITGIVVAAIIAVPLIFGLKKLRKNRTRAVIRA